VVLAHDAGPLGGNYYLAMEYVEGVDLFRLVKEKGPLPPTLACDYVRQTALGLQHIHERGLVHRDIKPSNLLLVAGDGAASAGTAALTTHQVKILDLGLARVSQSAVLEGLGVMTAVGTLLVGTLDYMAPEQARDFHQADIRADIYSLGCTLYFLLTGQPPFPEGWLAHKLMQHQNAEPRPIEQVRADLPPWLPAVVRLMLAKSPEDRFQTPAELAAVLARALDPPTSIAVALPVEAMAVDPAPHPLAEPVTRPEGLEASLEAEAVATGHFGLDVTPEATTPLPSTDADWCMIRHSDTVRVIQRTGVRRRRLLAVGGGSPWDTAPRRAGADADAE